MNVIDLEILIPASPEFIWRFLGDVSALPQWQHDVSSVMFLSTQREGNGTRWRALSDRSGDTVVEVSAWYDTVGYEYSLMDGAQYAENQGRIRLTEVTDGTLVRWTFQYEHKGMLGGLRNAMRLKRATTTRIQSSLRNLHQLIVRESGGISTHEAKASVKEAPDVGERSAYTPRHPSAFQESAARILANGASDDTDRKSAVFDFAALPQQPQDESDTRPNPVVLAPDFEAAGQDQPRQDLEDTKPVILEALPVEPAPVPMPPAQPAAPGPGDRSQLSVFEIFGLQKPSETSAATDTPARRPALPPAPDAQPPAPSPQASEEASDSAVSITGLRRRKRRRGLIRSRH